MGVNLQPEDLQTWLEWAGAKLVALPSDKIKPAEPRACWPDYSTELFQVLDHRRRDPLRAPVPSSFDIAIMDEVLLLPNICTNKLGRQILHARLLIHPIRHNYLNSWTKIATLLSMDRKTVRFRHSKALIEVVEKIPQPQVEYFTSLFEELL